MGLTCWSPLAGGVLTGKYRGAKTPPGGSRMDHRSKVDGVRFWHEHGLSIADRVVEIAEKAKISPVRLALAWMLGDSRVSAVIGGVRTAEQVDDLLAVGDWDVPRDVWEDLEEASRPTLRLSQSILGDDTGHAARRSSERLIGLSRRLA